jgi:hypothetical protein
MQTHQAQSALIALTGLLIYDWHIRQGLPHFDFEDANGRKIWYVGCGNLQFSR